MISEEKLKVQIFADGANVDEIRRRYYEDWISGFTTNPTLMKAAGIMDYLGFAKEILSFVTEKSVSFEVFSDDFSEMEREAEILSSLASNVYVKIPITNTKGISSAPLIRRLSNKGIKINVTAVFTLEQAREVIDSFVEGTSNYVSIFAGRIADTGTNPIPIVRQVGEWCHEKKGTRVLWASCREVFNIIQAEECNCDIITVTDGILKKLGNWGKNLDTFSLETVNMFYRDGRSLGYTIL